MTSGHLITEHPPVVVRHEPRRPYQEQAAYLRRRKLLQRVLAAGVPLALLSLWELAARAGWADSRVFPAPTMIAEQAVELVRSGRLTGDAWATLQRVLLGFPLGALAGIVLGIAMGLNPYVRSALELMLNGLYVVPKLALLPVFLSFLGFGEPPLVALIATTVFFFVWISTMEAVATIPAGYHEAARSLGLGRVRTFTDVIIPAILPSVFVSLRVGANVAILVIVAAEYIATNTGLGFLIFNSRQLLINGWMYVGIATVAILGVVLSSVIAGMGRLLTPWSQESRSRTSA
ncbi:ABC transporter permease [Nonomuraea wenchangensis]|uniref:ABC transporter permease n=1 Tax=Nonomuraea wenchangensis TaxID=568860 RepID=UPI00342FC630